MTRLILFLIRKKLGLKKYQRFYFENQADKTDRYYFTSDMLMKYSRIVSYEYVAPSNIRLNFLISNEAKKLIVKD